MMPDEMYTASSAFCPCLTNSISFYDLGLWVHLNSLGELLPALQHLLRIMVVHHDNTTTPFPPLSLFLHTHSFPNLLLGLEERLA